MQPSREEETHCPSCRRYVSTLERCPYCGVRVPKRLVFRLLKWGGLALAVCGVLVLYADALVFKGVIKDPPTITLAEIKPTMNFATVRIENVLITSVIYDELDITLGIGLRQGNETILLRVYEEETKRLIATRKVPGVGDYASVTAQLRVRPDFRMMILQAAGGLRWSRPEAENMSIPDLIVNAENLFYRRVRVEGRFVRWHHLRARGAPSPFATEAIVQDEMTGENLSILTYHNPWTKKFEELGIETGRRLRVSGAVSMYFDKVQLVLANTDEDIEVIG